MINERKHKIKIYEILFALCNICVCIYSGNESFILTWYAYTLFLVVGCLVICLRKQKLFINSEILMFFGFIIYSFISIMWAKYNSNQYHGIRFLMLMFFFTCISYWVFIVSYDSKKALINTFIISGSILSIYTPFKYGFSEYLNDMINGYRMGANIMGENSMGTFTAIATILAFGMYLFYRKKIYLLYIIINAFGCLSTGSRMSFLSLILGIVLIMLFYTLFTGNNLINSYTKFLLITVISIIVIYMILKYVPLFRVIYDRVDGLFQVILGNQIRTEGFGENGIRNILVRIGVNEFCSHPLFGIGYNNSRDAANIIVNTPFILHNNYVEVLCNGGICGFIIYYSFYFSLIYKHIKKVKTKDPIVAISLTLIFVNLFQQFAGVMYVEKYFYYYMVLWIIVANSKDFVKKESIGGKFK